MAESREKRDFVILMSQLPTMQAPESMFGVFRGRETKTLNSHISRLMFDLGFILFLSTFVLTTFHDKSFAVHLSVSEQQNEFSRNIQRADSNGAVQIAIRWRNHVKNEILQLE